MRLRKKRKHSEIYECLERKFDEFLRVEMAKANEESARMTLDELCSSIAGPVF